MVSSVVLNVISIVLVWVLLIVLVSIRRKNHAIANLLKEKSDQLQVSAEELRLLASTFNSHEPILITDQNLVVLRVNQAFLAATGYESHEVVGRKATDFSADDVASKTSLPFAQILSSASATPSPKATAKLAEYRYSVVVWLAPPPLPPVDWLCLIRCSRNPLDQIMFPPCLTVP